MSLEGDSGEGSPALDGKQDRRPRWRHPVALGALTIIVVAAVVVAIQYRPDQSPVRRATDATAAPNFSVPNLRDTSSTVDLDKLRGRPVVLNFWASWCVPCRKEMPAFEVVHGRVGDKVEFVGMNNQDTREDALTLMRETGVTYRSGFDPKGRVAEAYGLRGMPTTVFISGEGRVLATHAGEMSERQLVAAIQELFALQLPT